MPLAAIPIAVFVFAQVNEEPVGVLVKFPIFIRSPGHTVIFEMLSATGVG